MNRQDLITLYDYNYWANARILGATARVSPADFIAPRTFSHGGLRGTLAHALSAEWIWRVRCQEQHSPTALIREQDFLTFADLHTRWQQEEAAMRAYISSLSDEQISSTIAYRNTDGTPYEHLLWQILLHVINHGTQHRSEAAIILTELGRSPGNIDLSAYMREQKSDG